jgi:pSer/pThr/pTyr-binding forkhead associated (FHA) protein
VEPETILGRSPRSVIYLSSPSVSYEHALISRTGGEFFLENLSANGTYLGQERITGRAKLRTKDQFRIGEDTVARVESVPSAGSSNPRRRLLLIIVTVMVLLLLAAVVIDPFSNTLQPNWLRAYDRLQEWTQREVAAGKLPPETARLLQEAWRQESAGDRADAAKTWTRLHVMLADVEAANGIQSDPQQERQALALLMAGESKSLAMSEEEMEAAMVQFVIQMERKK